MSSLLDSISELDVVGRVSNGPEVIELAAQAQPDLVIIQVDAPPDQAAKTLTRLKSASPRSRVLVVTNVEDPAYAQALLEHGASAYLIKSIHFDGLVGAVRDVARNPDLSEDKALHVPVEAVESPQDGFRGTISERQMEVLLLAARGLSNRQIGASLHLSETTVSRHLANIYGKMGVSSRSQASKMAMARGWISLLDITT